MKKSLITLGTAAALFTTGCTSVTEELSAGAGGKNLAIDGYVMYCSAETADNDTGTPSGKLIIGRLTYKSRKVGIPADQKVPTTGSFKSTRTRTLFGTEEQIIEYDFTAGSESAAAAVRQDLSSRAQQALAVGTEKE